MLTVAPHHPLAKAPEPLSSTTLAQHRIIAVADTYDSITSSRAYRAGRSHEVAMAEIARVAGTQLDPGVIMAFEQVCRLEPEWIARFGIQRDAAVPAAAARA